MTVQHEAHETTDHEEIRRWTEARGGHPATVKGTEERGEHAGVLRIAFTDGDNLEQIDWDDFFEKFDEAHLAFLYQERTKDGKPSRFFKFVERH
ncbi:MAG TPA: hypothetical protein VFB32_08395 [Rudaea sp.]|nr:hypothetical protein [Rudaea sp.]